MTVAPVPPRGLWPSLGLCALALCGLAAWLVGTTPSDGDGHDLLRWAHVSFVEGDPLMAHWLLFWGICHGIGLLLIVLSLGPIRWIAPRLAASIRAAADRITPASAGPSRRPRRPAGPARSPSRRRRGPGAPAKVRAGE